MDADHRNLLATAHGASTERAGGDAARTAQQSLATKMRNLRVV